MFFQDLFRCSLAGCEVAARGCRRPLRESYEGFGKAGVGRVDQQSNSGCFWDQLARSSSRFGPISTFKLCTPVTLPPGRFRLDTSPASTGSTAVAKTIGIVAVAAFAASAEAAPPPATITSHVVLDKLRRKRGQSLVVIFRPAIFHRNVLAFDKACIFQSLPKRVQADRVFVLGHTAKETDNWGCRLLPIYCEWPNGRGPTKKKNMNSRRLIAAPEALDRRW